MTKILTSREHQIQEGFPAEVALKEGQRWACRETGKTMTSGAPNIKTLHTIECLLHVPSFSHSTRTQPYSYPHFTGWESEAQLSHTQMLMDGTGIGAHPGSPGLWLWLSTPVLFPRTREGTQEFQVLAA